MEGFAITLDPEVDDNPCAGVHVYVVAPEAVKFACCPKQSTGLFGVTVTIGVGLTFTVTGNVKVHPSGFVAVTEYVVVVVGLATTVFPVVFDKPAEGDQSKLNEPFAVNVTCSP